MLLLDATKPDENEVVEDEGDDLEKEEEKNKKEKAKGKGKAKAKEEDLEPNSLYLSFAQAMTGFPSKEYAVIILFALLELDN